MPKIVECIPNFSVAQDSEIVEALAQLARSMPGVLLLDYSADSSYNRSVFTLAGDPERVAEAAFQLCKLAAERIDMTKHKGEHPRMGATDVIPFVPLRDMDTAECVALAKALGQRIAEELHVPIFLYEDSASCETRRNLAAVRKGEFEGMSEKLLLEEWAPDFGQRAIHPTAGVTAVGARMPLVAFNVTLDTPDIAIASAIAKTVRGSSGGYRHCKAIGVALEERGLTQVSMNMVNYEGTPLYRAFEAIRFEAARYGVRIIDSEIIGLTPAAALLDTAAYYLQLRGFDSDTQVLEHHIINYLGGNE